MKKWLAAAAAVLLLLGGCAQRVQIGAIEQFTFRFTNGQMADSDSVYALSFENGAYWVSVKPAFAPPEAQIQIPADEDFARELEQILCTYEVQRWNGFHKKAAHGMDGDRFELSVRMQDGGQIEASGSMKWPENYAAVREAVAALFEKLAQ